MNRLANETSLYLRQHAGNPVDWYPWGPEALALARQHDRPIFLSIGYSACHWCHVMEHESFENADTAGLMNQHFVCIKVDREERPDLDDIYMKSVQLLNRGQGGWPMSVWLAPDLRPFYAGTYFPPDDRYGRPSFRRVLVSLAEAWATRRDDLLRSAGEITDHLQSMATLDAGPDAVDREAMLRPADAALMRSFDPRHGGFGSAPKFPHALELRLLLRTWKRFGDANPLAAVRLTLDRMARGGMYDQLGGGFHRYSVDATWLVPHFEKMLYDNALLAVTYLEGYQATGDPFYRQIVEETLDYVQREMTCPAGGFYSTQDADSEGEEGKFFVWSKAEFDAIVGDELAQVVGSTWGVTESGNFEGHTILWRKQDDAADAQRLGLDVSTFVEMLRKAREQLFTARETRIKPGRDEKILTAWNGLMIAALARAGAVLARSDYTASAVKAAEFIERHLWAGDGRLWRTCDADGNAKLMGYLEDYTYLADGLTHLFESTGDERWLSMARELMATVETHFADEHGGWYTTADDHESLILRIKDQHDGSTPSGNAMGIMTLARLAELTGDMALQQSAERHLAAFHGVMTQHPAAAVQMLIAAEFLAGPVQSAVIVGERLSHEFNEVLGVARGDFEPRRVVVTAGPLAADKPSTGPVTLYLCEHFTCQPPVHGVAGCRQRLTEMDTP